MACSCRVAWSGRSDAAWAELTGIEPEVAAANDALLLGPTLAHPDPRAAAQVWRLLGAEVEGGDEGLRISWPDAPLDIEVVPGPQAGPVGLRFADTDAHPGDEAVGPATLVV